MRFLNYEELLRLYEICIESTGGSYGIRENEVIKGALESPKSTFGGRDLYPTLIDKVAILGFSLISYHPFVDGNKRIGYLAMKAMLSLNGLTINASTDEKEKIILSVADGRSGQDGLAAWLKKYTHAIT